ncbi:MAG: hypothetical protein ACK56I_14760, partial [bacterium]
CRDGPPGSPSLVAEPPGHDECREPTCDVEAREQVVALHELAHHVTINLVLVPIGIDESTLGCNGGRRTAHLVVTHGDKLPAQLAFCRAVPHGTVVVR